MKSIIVIEDDEFLRDNITAILEGEGYAVSNAANGLEGLNLIKNGKFDVIICDVLMPGIDGYEVLKRVNDMPLKIPPAFIFLTAKTDRRDLRKGMELGASDFITKPFVREEIINAVQTQIMKRENISRIFNTEKELLKMIKDKLKTETLNKDKHTDTETGELKYEGNIFFTDNAKSDFIRINTIVYLIASKDYTKIFTKDNKSYLVRKPMKIWESKLPKEYFLRIHRSTIINTEYVDKVEKWFNYSHKIFLKGIKEPFIISQRYSRKFRKQITHMK